jgi:hypothetical protein
MPPLGMWSAVVGSKYWADLQLAPGMEVAQGHHAPVSAGDNPVGRRTEPVDSSHSAQPGLLPGVSGAGRCLSDWGLRLSCRLIPLWRDRDEVQGQTISATTGSAEAFTMALVRPQTNWFLWSQSRLLSR